MPANKWNGFFGLKFWKVINGDVKTIGKFFFLLFSLKKK